MAITVASGVKLAAGTGRTFDGFWPPVGTSRVTAGVPSTAGTFRQGPAAAAGLVAITTAITGTVTYQKYKEAAPARFRCVAAATDIAAVKYAFPFYPQLQQVEDLQVGNPSTVFRFLCVAAYGAALAGAIGANADLGLEIIPQNNTTMNASGGTRAGIMFGPVSATEIAIRSRVAAAGALTELTKMTAAAAGVTDITKFNLYELRVVNATNAQPAQLKAYINGAAFGNAIDMDAASAQTMAIDAGGGGFMGWEFSFANSQTEDNYDAYALETHMIISAAEDDAA